MLSIDQIAYENRWLHVSPLKKTALYSVLLLSMFAVSPIVAALLSVLIGILTIYLAKIRVLRYLKWYLLPLPFLVVSVGTIVVTIAAKQENLLVSLGIGAVFLGIDKTAIDPALHLFFRSLGCLVCTYFYALTVPFQQIIFVMKKCHFPLVLIEITMLMYRFIFILIEEAMLIYHAQEIRFGYHGIKNGYRSFGMLAQMLFVRSMARYKELSSSLEVKCFQGEFPI